jgi:hypothetical protein
VNEVYDFMNGKSEQTLSMIIDSTIYFVAIHYKLSIPQVLDMSSDDFEQSLVWAAAAKKVEGDEMDKMSTDMKSGADIASTKRKGDPFPFE